MPSMPSPPRRSAFNLVEILVAMFVVTVSLFPVVTYFITLQASGEAEEAQAEAVGLASNIVETLISSQVPFEAIDPDGGAGLVGAQGPGFGPVSQAGFRATFDAGSKLTAIVQDSVVGSDRIKKSRKGLSFRVYFFAGIYYDRPNTGLTAGPGKLADPQKELTFSYLEGPHGEQRAIFWGLTTGLTAATNNKTILSNSLPTIDGKTDFTPNPYKLKSFRKTAAGPGVSGYSTVSPTTIWDFDPTKSDYDKLPGWPQPHHRSSEVKAGGLTYAVRDPDNRPAYRDLLSKVVTGAIDPTWAYHPQVRDQGYYRNEIKGGGLMKIVVGVKYKPYNFTAKAASNSVEQEFWLVSLKARLGEAGL